MPFMARERQPVNCLKLKRTYFTSIFTKRFIMYTILEKYKLFKDIDSNNIETLLAKITFQVKTYQKDDIVVFSGEKLNSLKIIVEGSVKGQMVDFNGKIIKIEDIEGPRALAPAFLFGESNRYPVDIVASNNVRIISIPKADFLHLLSLSQILLHNFLDIVSDKAQFLSGKLKFLSFQSIKGKLANYLLSMAKESGSNSVLMTVTHTELSEIFGVTRPSLSRAIREMDADGIIRIEGKTIILTDKQKLFSLLR